MLFNSLSFLIFFPIVVLVYFIFPRRFRYLWLLAASYYSYMSWNPFHVVFLLISTIVTYSCARLIEAVRGWEKIGESAGKKAARAVLFLCFLVNIGILIYFKYTNFLLASFRSLLSRAGLTLVPKVDLLLPIGISFYTFQALGYAVDVYRKEISAEKNLLRYALFVSFFPQLVAGPIERSGNLLNQVRREANHKLWNYRRVTSGLTMMLWGFFLKVGIADRAAVLANQVFDGYEQYQMVGLSLGAIAFAIQIYCDFSGYSIIAAGAAKVLGFELMQNFETPYFSRGIREFWRRWHISLSTWFRDYLYIPLGGSRCAAWKRYRNILITFAVSGLWHGAAWTYVVWGVLHGIYQVVELWLTPVIGKIHRICHTRTESFGYKLFQAAVTFFFVDLAWIFFRAQSLHQAIHYIWRMFAFRDWWSLFDGSIYTMGLQTGELHLLFCGCICLFLVDWLWYKKKVTLDVFLEKQWIGFRWAVLIGLLFACVGWGYYGPGFHSAQFLYFQF